MPTKTGLPRNFFSNLLGRIAPAHSAAPDSVPAARRPDVPREALRIVESRSLSEFSARCSEIDLAAIGAFQDSMLGVLIDLPINGYCACCRQLVRFDMPSQCLQGSGNPQPPNWREELVCPHCQLNNRVRYCFSLLETVAGPNETSKIYLTEQVSRAFAWLKSQFAGTIGSEFFHGETVRRRLQDQLTFITKDPSLRLHFEDLTALSFRNDETDVVLSFDVLEHVPDYRAALRECHRILKKNGMLILSVPFIDSNQATIVRATMDEHGEINHLLEPELHGNSISEQGCLCFYHFGWDLVDDLRTAGFSDAYLASTWSPVLGHLGHISAFVARK